MENNPSKEASEREPLPPNMVSTFWALLVIGLGIGWLTGLSVSPVIGVVVGSAIGVAAVAVTALGGLKDTPPQPTQSLTTLSKITLWPLAILVVAIVLGSWWGTVARNNHLFGSDVDSEITKWTDVGVPKEAVLERLFGVTANYSPYTTPMTETLQVEIDRWEALGIPREQVAVQLFEQYMAMQASAASSPLLTADKRTGTILYVAAVEEECEAWQKLIAKESYDELIRQVGISEVIPLRRLPAIITDPVQLATVLEEVLCAKP